MRFILFLLLLIGCAHNLPVPYQQDFTFITDNTQVPTVRNMNISTVFVATQLTVTEVIGLKEDGKLVIKIMPIALPTEPYWVPNWSMQLQQEIDSHLDYGYDGFAFTGINTHIEFAYISSIPSSDAMIQLIKETHAYLQEQDAQMILYTDDDLAMQMDLPILSKRLIDTDKTVYIDAQDCETFRSCKEKGYFCATSVCEY